MLTKEGLDFILHITNYFHGHWEDPGWGRAPLNQVLIQLTAMTLAEGIEDAGVRADLQGALGKGVANAAQAVARGR
jgi:hypothetical protein